ncbi:putative mosc domain containing protein [Daldinia childiae]|uniref:putative mosc domain containing protein n=1 Tax=Daldinia childiae TaxID=326645 RepID=UPI0014478DB5|nr:putative mosc domain containing protein [Daldinia childiae]KAF3061418.1 putative mosc domain containing protein [Daldinia childiae]
MGHKTLQITELYIYPIKSLRPVSLDRALLQREGLRYDRRFMLLKAEAGGGYKNIQVYHFPECALFHQAIDNDNDDDHVVVTYRIPEHPLVVPPPPEQYTALRVPLNPAIAGLETVDIKLFSSSATTYRMGDTYDAWFSACLGYRTILVYIGDNRRSVLAHAPQPEQPQTQSWFSHLTSFVPYYGQQQPSSSKEKASGLVFNEAAPFLLTSKASLRNVSARLPEGQEMDMIKFRPNIVVDEVWEESSGSEDSDDDAPSILAAWDEDFWAELSVGSTHRLALTANCARCVSINVDYAAGRPASGELGSVLKKLMKDRRVDAGNKWSPIFGRYAFLLPSANSSSSGGGEAHELDADVAVGDEVKVMRRISERDTWAWPK